MSRGEEIRKSSANVTNSARRTEIRRLKCFRLYLCKTWSAIWCEFCFHLGRVKINVTRCELLISAVEAAKAKEGKAVKVGDVFITFISALILEVILSLRLLFAFLWLFRIKMFLCQLKKERRQHKKKNTVKWKCFIAHFISSYKSFYLNNIFFWHSFVTAKQNARALRRLRTVWLLGRRRRQQKRSCQYFMFE